MSRVTSFSEWLLRQAFIWGGLVCLAFYAFIVHGTGDGSFWARYFAGHSIAYCTTALFFIGLAALLIKLLGVMMQFATLERAKLAPAGNEGQTPEESVALLRDLDKSHDDIEDSYIVKRLRDALQYVKRVGSADSLEQHLRHLEEADYARMHQGYAMTRIILSTIPILGFLGTVIGITLAIAKLNLSGEALDDSLPAVVQGLSVAFDTTALALSLSTLLLFAKFCVERVEVRLLNSVDENVSRQLVGRFRQYGSDNDPHLASVRRMNEDLLTTVKNGMIEQATLMKQSFEQSSRQWSEILSDTASTLDEALSGAVLEGMTRHASALNEGVRNQTASLEETFIRHAELLNEGLEHHSTVVEQGLTSYTQSLSAGLEEHRIALTEAETQLAQENRRHLADVEAAVGEAMLVATNRQEKLIKQSETLLKEMQTALIEAAGSTVAQQEQLNKQSDILLQVIEATNQVKQLEDALNSNLNALAGAQNFQQTAAGLSAALQLMSVHLVGKPLDTAAEIELAYKQQSQPGHSKAA